MNGKILFISKKKLLRGDGAVKIEKKDFLLIFGSYQQIHDRL